MTNMIDSRIGGIITTPLLASVLLLFSLTACEQRDVVQDEVQQLRQQTIPPASTLTSQAGVTRTRNSATASWEFETEWTWRKYTEWISDRLPHDYKLVSKSVNELSFRHQLPDDDFALRIVGITSNSVVQIHVDFVAQPD